MGETHPFIETLDALSAARPGPAGNPSEFEDFVNVPGVAEQLALRVASAPEAEALSAAKYLRLLRPGPARRVILRRLAALPLKRRALLAELLSEDEIATYGDLLQSTLQALERERLATCLVSGHRDWLDAAVKGRLTRLTPEGLRALDAQRVATDPAAGVVTAFGPLLPLKLRPPTRSLLWTLLGHQPGEPAARVLEAELAEAASDDDRRAIRRELFRQRSATDVRFEGTCAVQLGPPGGAGVPFVLEHLRGPGSVVRLSGVLAASGGVLSLVVERSEAPGGVASSFVACPGPLFRSFVAQAAASGSREVDVVLERLAGLEPEPLAWPAPYGRLDVEAISRLSAERVLDLDPAGRWYREAPKRRALRTPATRRALVERLKLSAAYCMLVSRRDDASALLAEAAFVSSARASAVYEAIEQRRHVAPRPSPVPDDRVSDLRARSPGG